MKTSATEHREIPLTSGYVALVDTQDYDLLKDHRWYALCSNGFVYAAYRPKRSTKTILMHRVILGATGRARVRWVNRNTLDNRRNNIQIIQHLGGAL